MAAPVRAGVAAQASGPDFGCRNWVDGSPSVTGWVAGRRPVGWRACLRGPAPGPGFTGAVVAGAEAVHHHRAGVVDDADLPEAAQAAQPGPDVALELVEVAAA